MERSYEMRDHEIVYMSALTTSEGLRTDPRFHEILRRLNLPMPVGAVQGSHPPATFTPPRR